MDPPARPAGPSRSVPARGADPAFAVFVHDLNNLLGIVMGNAELLLDGEENVQKRGKRTKAIHIAATQAAELVMRLQQRLG